MNPFDLLNTGLLDLLYELRGADTPLTVGGGYGLYLKQRYIRRSKLRTLFDAYPPSRSTNDIDLFLQTEILADNPVVMRDALQRAGYSVVERREYWQFAKTFPDLHTLLEGQQVRLDLLTPQPADNYIQQKRIRVETGRRVLRVKPGTEGITLHAHLTKEAVAIEKGKIEVSITGQRSTGEEYADSVLLPQAFTYLVMKLFAFRDREFTRSDREQAMKHAFDLYPIVAMMTADEYETVRQLGKEYKTHEIVVDAIGIIRRHFSNVEAMGMLRMREHPDFSDAFDLPEFIKVLADVFQI